MPACLTQHSRALCHLPDLDPALGVISAKIMVDTVSDAFFAPSPPGREIGCLALCEFVVPRVSQTERLMESPDTEFRIFLIDDTGDLDLRGADHQDIDALTSERREHTGGDTGMA